MTCRGEANVFAHRHQEYIRVDEKEVNTHRDALLWRYKFTWHRHNCRRFPSHLLSRVVSLHLDDRRAPNLPHDSGIVQRDFTTLDRICAQGCVKVRLQWTLQHFVQLPCFRRTFYLLLCEHLHFLFHCLHKCRPWLTVKSFHDVQPDACSTKRRSVIPWFPRWKMKALSFLLL